MEYLLNCDNVRIVAAPDRRDWKRRAAHPLEAQISSAAGTHFPVLISATKTRARSIAEQIHRRSCKGDHQLAVVDCSLPPHHYEQHVFQTDTAQGGSILLLEVGHLSQGLQMRLRARLTVEARARSIGASEALVGTRRILSSSSSGLYEAVQRGLFDRDLFYRLNTFHIVAK
jgi:DNA-binding NtrC family response regulator